MPVEQLELADGTAHKLRVGRDDGLNDADLIGWRVDLMSLAFAGQLQLLERHDSLERRRLALQDKNVFRLDHHITCGLIAPLGASEQRDDFDLGLAEILKCLQRQPSAIGISMARAPIFLTKAESRVTEPTKATISRLMVVRDGPSRTNTSPSSLLMPMSFGALLGGIVTLVGTSPIGHPYNMFDFTPVGVGIAIVGFLFLCFGWRLLIAMMGLFARGRWRYDLVAVLALLVAVAVGIVKPNEAFKGFSDDIVIIVASALVVSAAVALSGVIERYASRLSP